MSVPKLYYTCILMPQATWIFPQWPHIIIWYITYTSIWVSLGNVYLLTQNVGRQRSLYTWQILCCFRGEGGLNRATIMEVADIQVLHDWSNTSQEYFFQHHIDNETQSLGQITTARIPGYLDIGRRHPIGSNLQCSRYYSCSIVEPP